MNSGSQWNAHYTRGKSSLSYPDENLVRMLSVFLSEQTELSEYSAIDIGCGSGRHIKLLAEFGIPSITGTDYSHNAMLQSRQYTSNLIQCDNEQLPFKNQSFDIAVSWGSLHYTTKDRFALQIREIHRIIKPGGCLFGTLRSSFDTMLKSGEEIAPGTWRTDLADISGSIVSFYSEEELKSALSIFSGFSYGIIERTRLGSTDKRISHWYFKAQR